MTTVLPYRLRRSRRAILPARGESRWAQCGPWLVHYRVVGTGPPVLLLHGLGSSSRYWERLSAALAGRYRLIIPDLLGFGDSSKPYITYDPALHCRAVEAVLDDAGTGDLHAVIGHSLGAVLAATLVAHAPVRPATLVLITPPFPTGRGSMREEVRRLSPVNRFLLSCVPVTRLTHVGMQAVWPAVCRARTHRALFSPELLAEYGKYTYHSYISTLNRCLFDYDVRPALKRIGPLPALVLQAARDTHVPPTHAPGVAAHLPTAVMERLPSRHHPALSHADLLAERLRAWLDAHQPARPTPDP